MGLLFNFSSVYAYTGGKKWQFELNMVAYCIRGSGIALNLWRAKVYRDVEADWRAIGEINLSTSLLVWWYPGLPSFIWCRLSYYSTIASQHRSSRLMTSWLWQKGWESKHPLIADRGCISPLLQICMYPGYNFKRIAPAPRQDFVAAATDFLVGGREGQERVIR